MDGDQRGGAGVVLAPDDLQELAALGAVADAVAFDPGQHQIAVPHVGAGGQDQTVLGAAVDGLDPDFAVHLAHDAQDAVRALAQALDEFGLMLAGFQADKPDQQTIPQARRGCASLGAGGQRHDRRVLALDQADQQITIHVALDDVHHADLRQSASLGEAASAAPAQGALSLQGGQHFPQGAAVGALEAKGGGQVGLGGLSMLANVGDQRLAGRQALRRASRFRGLGSGHRRSLARNPDARS